MSSRPCVGWAWRPSPALTTWMCSRRWPPGAGRSGRARRWRRGARRTCRPASPPGCPPCRAGSRPWRCDEVLMLRLMTSAERRLAAISKVVRVRVEFSKNRLNTLLPRSSGTFFTSRSATSVKGAARSRMPVRISRGRPSRVSRWISSPLALSCGLRVRSFFARPGRPVRRRRGAPARASGWPAASAFRRSSVAAIGSSRPPRSTSTARSMRAGRP